MYPHCTVRIRLLYAFNKYFDFDFDSHSSVIHSVAKSAVCECGQNCLVDMYRLTKFSNHSEFTVIASVADNARNWLFSHSNHSTHKMKIQETHILQLTATKRMHKQCTTVVIVWCSGVVIL